MPQLYFYTKPDCAPCAAMKPTLLPLLDRLQEQDPTITVTLVNAVADDALELVTQHKVRTVPCLIVADNTGARIAGFTGRLIEASAIERAVAVAGQLDRARAVTDPR